MNIRKHVTLLCVLFFSFTTLFSQSSFKVSIKPFQVHLFTDTIGVLEITITNNTNTPIKLPSKGILINKETVGFNELGGIITFGKNRERITCDLSIDDIIGVVKSMEQIAPAETKKVKLELFGDCFKRKGEYEITFFIRRLETKSKKNSHKYYSSNTVKIIN